MCSVAFHDPPQTMRTLSLLALAFVATSAAAQTPCVDGTASGYDCERVDLLAFISPQDLGTPEAGACPNPYPGLCANDVWGWTDPDTERRYAIVGLSNGTAFVDVTVPTAPVRLGVLPTATAPSSWRDVKAIGNVAVVVSEAPGHGMQVFDLTRLRGLTEDATRVFDADARYMGIGSAHNVVVNESTGYAYTVGARVASGQNLPAACNTRGFHAVNLQDPLNPTFGGCFSDAATDVAPVIQPGYTHDAQCITYDGPDTDYTGREVCFAANEDVVTIFDVTDKDNVIEISQAEYPNDAYTHQGWLTEDRRYFLTNDELDETRAVNGGDPTPLRTLVIDVSDLDAPDFAFEYRPGLASIDHNLYVVGDLAFESNYEVGLRVIDLSGIDDEVLEEVAFFDTYEPSNSVNFAGQWSNYPFFGDGLVLANDGETGFFVLRLDPAVLAVGSESGPEAGAARLSDPVPNPTASGAQLTLRVGTTQTVRADLYDVAGRLVRPIFSGVAASGDDVVLDVDTDDLPAGVYFVRVVGDEVQAARRLVVTR